ncbi:hypothetical protein N8878_05790 [Psychromonas sp.]|nr:hypothetical protein [Psychromonas sp.]
MFKLLLYAFFGFVCFWLASDVEIGASVYKFEDNHLSLEFPKASFRDFGEAPWVDFYWNASSSKKEIVDMKKAITK